MKVILKETIDSLGIIGNEVTVADGYARNYLLPQNKAVLATPQNRKILEQDRKKFELQIAKEKEFAEKMAARLNGVSCKISAKVSEGANYQKCLSKTALLRNFRVLSAIPIVAEKKKILSVMHTMRPGTPICRTLFYSPKTPTKYPAS